MTGTQTMIKARLAKNLEGEANACLHRVINEHLTRTGDTLNFSERMHIVKRHAVWLLVGVSLWLSLTMLWALVFDVATVLELKGASFAMGLWIGLLCAWCILIEINSLYTLFGPARTSATDILSECGARYHAPVDDKLLEHILQSTLSQDTIINRLIKNTLIDQIERPVNTVSGLTLSELAEQAVQQVVKCSHSDRVTLYAVV